MSSLICPSCGAQTPRLAGNPDATIHCLKCRAPIPAETLAPPAEGDDGASSTPTYKVERYQPTRGGSPLGVLVAVATGLLGALVLGVVAAAIRQLFWLVLIFAIFLGCGLGAAAGIGGWMSKCRRTDVLAGAGVVAGLAGAFVMHYVRYLILTSDLPPGQISFPQFLDLLCQAGVMGFGYTGSMIYYAIEAVVIVVAAGVVAANMSNDPFCESCNVWKKKQRYGPFRINANVAVAAIASGQPKQLVAPPDGDEAVTLDIFRCPHCQSTGTIDVRAVGTITDGKNTATATVFVTYPGEAEADLTVAVAACHN